MQCINETQRYLCKVLHEVGLELRSAAVCTGVRRTRDGPFDTQAALTRHHWTAPDVMQAIRKYRSLREAGKRAPGAHAESSDGGAQDDTARQRQESGEQGATVAALH